MVGEAGILDRPRSSTIQIAVACRITVWVCNEKKYERKDVRVSAAKGEMYGGGRREGKRTPAAVMLLVFFLIPSAIWIRIVMNGVLPVLAHHFMRAAFNKFPRGVAAVASFLEVLAVVVSHLAYGSLVGRAGVAADGGRAFAGMRHSIFITVKR